MNDSILRAVSGENIIVQVPFSYQRESGDNPGEILSLTGGTYRLWDTNDVILGAKERTPEYNNAPDRRRLLIMNHWISTLISGILGRDGKMKYERREVSGDLDISNDHACASIEEWSWIILSDNEANEIERIFGILIPATQHRIDEILAEKQVT